MERMAEQDGHPYGAVKLPPSGGMGTDAPGSSHCRCCQDGLGSSLDISHSLGIRARQAQLMTANPILLLKGLMNMPMRPVLRKGTVGHTGNCNGRVKGSLGMGRSEEMQEEALF